MLAAAVMFARPVTGADRPLSVHCIKGLWHNYYRLDEAFARSGVNQVTESWHVSRWGFGSPGNWGSGFSSGIESFPASTNVLARNDVVIVCNINGKALTQSGAADKLRAYAQQGGAVLFLGGRYAFGGEYRSGALSDMAPVVFGEGFDLQQETNGLAVAASAGATESIHELSWSQAPRVYWRHRLQPKPDAKILLEAGGEPLLITSPCGQGRVSVFAGTVMGDPPSEQVAFWEWKDWPALLAALLRTDLQATANDGGATKQNALRRLAAAMDSEKDIDEAAIDAIADAAWPWVGPPQDGQARALLASGQINKVCLGLRIIAARRSVDALETLRRALVSGTMGEPQADLMAEPGEMMNEQRIRAAAVTALGDLGTAEALKLLQATAAGLAKGAYPPGTQPESVSPDNKRYQIAMLSRLRCGDETAAGPIVDFLMEHIYMIARGRTWETSIPDYVTETRRQLPATRAWQETLLAKLPLVPDAGLPALARRVAAEKDWRVTLIALRCFGGKSPDGALRAILATSPIPAVAALGGKN
jgi:uncharacterized membrane protein